MADLFYVQYRHSADKIPQDEWEVAMTDVKNENRTVIITQGLEEYAFAVSWCYLLNKLANEWKHNGEE